MSELKFEKQIASLQEIGDWSKYKNYVLDTCKSPPEWAFFFTANGNKLHLEWQKEVKYHHYNKTVESIHPDFYYEDETGNIRVVIECDDSTHKKTKESDKIRDKMLEAQGKKVFRFPVKDITWNCLSCVNEVKDFINKRKVELEKESYNRKFKQENISISVKTISEENPSYSSQVNRSYVIK